MCEKSICNTCGQDHGPAETRFFYQVTVDQVLAGMEYYKSMQIPQNDYLSSLLLFSMKTDYPRCLLTPGCPGTFCRCDVLCSFPNVFTMSFIYSSDHMEKDKLRPLYYVGLVETCD